MQQIESAHKPLAGWRLLLRGVAVLAGVVLLAGIAIAKSQGAFADHVRVTALLSDVGDGLPKGSDVKFRGALVGAVTKVTPALGGRPNAAELSIDPHFAPEIPATVTARVVPSNVFAVSSIQLVDNGPGAGSAHRCADYPGPEPGHHPVPDRTHQDAGSPRRCRPARVA